MQIADLIPLRVANLAVGLVVDRCRHRQRGRLNAALGGPAPEPQGSLMPATPSLSFAFRWVIQTAPSIVPRQIAPCLWARTSPGAPCRAPPRGRRRGNRADPSRHRARPVHCRQRGSSVRSSRSYRGSNRLHGRSDASAAAVGRAHPAGRSRGLRLKVISTRSAPRPRALRTAASVTSCRYRLLFVLGEILEGKVCDAQIGPASISAAACTMVTPQPASPVAIAQSSDEVRDHP